MLNFDYNMHSQNVLTISEITIQILTILSLYIIYTSHAIFILHFNCASYIYKNICYIYDCDIVFLKECELFLAMRAGLMLAEFQKWVKKYVELASILTFSIENLILACKFNLVLCKLLSELYLITGQKLPPNWEDINLYHIDQTSWYSLHQDFLFLNIICFNSLVVFYDTCMGKIG